MDEKDHSDMPETSKIYIPFPGSMIKNGIKRMNSVGFKRNHRSSILVDWRYRMTKIFEK